MPAVTPPAKTAMCSSCTRFCPPCSCNSPPALTKDWSLGRDLTSCPSRDICVGPCLCSDVCWDELVVEIKNEKVVEFETVLCKSLSSARLGRGGNQLWALELDIPDEIFVCDDVEVCHWNAHAFEHGKSPAAVNVRGLPPCLHRVHALIDKIFSGWHADMAELSRLLIQNEKRSRKEHDEGQKQKALSLQEEKNQQSALSLQRRNHSHKKQRLTNNF
jgi:hypothetical protein